MTGHSAEGGWRHDQPGLEQLTWLLPGREPGKGWRLSVGKADWSFVSAVGRDNVRGANYPVCLTIDYKTNPGDAVCGYASEGCLGWFPPRKWYCRKTRIETNTGEFNFRDRDLKRVWKWIGALMRVLFGLIVFDTLWYIWYILIRF